jgi:DNA polymerase
MAAFLYGTTPEGVTKAQRQMGKIIILGCGYGMGAMRFVETAETWGVHVSPSEAMVAVNAYRAKYSLVKDLWYKLKDATVDAIKYPGKTFTFKRCSFRVVKCRAGNHWLMITLPSGRALYYMEPHLGDDPYGVVPGHYGTNPYTKKWDRLKLIPGRIIENIIQALARDIMAQGLLNIKQKMPYVTLIGTVHDEAIAIIKDLHVNTTTVGVFNRHLCRMPTWADGLPLEAEGWIGARYKK